MPSKNTKKLVIGHAPGFGIVIHINASSINDLNKAATDFSKIEDVKEVSVLSIKNS